jgi:hypothetical protein
VAQHFLFTFSFSFFTIIYVCCRATSDQGSPGTRFGYMNRNSMHCELVILAGTLIGGKRAYDISRVVQGYVTAGHFTLGPF